MSAVVEHLAVLNLKATVPKSLDLTSNPFGSGKKIVAILRGVSGSGKSSLAKCLVEKFDGALASFDRYQHTFLSFALLKAQIATCN